MRHFFSVIACIVTLPLLAAGKETRSPQQIQHELEQDEAMFKEAKEMFNPWYAGPLLTGSAHMMPPGSGNVQPYIFVTDNYAAWNEDRKSVKTPSTVTLNPQAIFQFGITDTLDMTIVAQGVENWKQHHSAGGFGDMSVGIGFPILREGLYVPAIRITATERFPTGRYEKLSSKKQGIDGIGGGSYQTTFAFLISKVVFWSYTHPVSLRGSYTYTIPSTVKVHGYNTYGGGHGTNGTVRPGNYQQANFAFEYSFTQHWVFANDFVYVWSNKTKFHGKPGVTSTGAPAAVGSGSNDQLSLAPAIEYNWNSNLGVLAGIWFDVYGRNTAKFVSGIFTVTYAFDF